jgi:hypothetical protein
MSATVEVNVLLYASDTSSDFHDAALEFLGRKAAGPDILCLFWPTNMGYLRIATHPAIFERPLEPDAATANVEALLALPHVRTPGETERFWDVWREATRVLVVRGNLVPDAHVVALMREHGVRDIWTRDRDFRKFDGIRSLDPFAAGPS